MATHSKKKRNKLIYLIIAVVIIAAIGITLFLVLKEDKQPYEFFDWGTTRVDVIAGLDNMKLEYGFDVTGENNSDKVVYKEYDFFGHETWVSFEFDDNLRLNQVSIIGSCDSDEEVVDLVDALKNKYGTPSYEDNLYERLGIKWRFIDWTTKDSKVDFSVVGGSSDDVGGSYEFTLSPLSEESATT